VDAFESAGEWWLPEYPDARVIGLLRYSDEDGFRLEIPVGCLGEMTHFFNRPNQSRSEPVVHGKLRNGKTVTLVDVMRTAMNLSSQGAGKEEYSSQQGFIGDIESEANPLIDRLHLTYSHLRDWVVWHHSTLTGPVEDDQLGLSVDYHYEKPADTELAAGDGWQIRLGHKFTLTSPSVQGFHLKHDCYLTLELDMPLTLNEVENRFLTSLFRFLSFCLDRSTHTQEVNVRPYGQNNWLEVGRAQGKPSPSRDNVMEPFMLMSMRQLAERTAGILGRWLEFKGDELRAMSILVGLYSNHSIPSDLRFLAAAQALEAMSRVDAQEKELDDNEFARRLSVVANSVEDKKVRKWAERKLKHVSANSRYAGELLQDLAINIGEYANTLTPDSERFFQDIRDNRNFYTHRDDRRAKRVLEGGELYVLTQGLVCLLKAAVLRRLGFSQEETQSLMDDCQGCLQWRFRVAKQYSKPLAEVLESGQSRSRIPMTYERIKDLNATDFKRLYGVSPETFAKMVEVVQAKLAQRSKPLTQAKLSIEDQILLTLGYLQECHTYFHIGQTWGVHKSTVGRIIQKIKTILIQSESFRLPSKKRLT
jgi:ApeA N-terminal domain 1/Helix-turn-helix of DDE superfamily endonuclease